MRDATVAAPMLPDGVAVGVVIAPHARGRYTALRAAVPLGMALHPRGEVAEWLIAAVSKTV